MRTAIRNGRDEMKELLDNVPEQTAPKPAGRGAPRLRRAERQQVELRAMSLDELIGPDHLARLVWQMARRFDLQPLLDQVVAREGTPGHPQTDPAILVALWLYATLDGVGSARALARLCEQHHAYRWLCGSVSTNYHTLADFRVDHADWLDRELSRGLAGLMAAGEVSLESVAHDGMRVRAAAGGSSFRRKPRLEQFLTTAQARVAALKAELAGEPDRRTRRQAAVERAARERLARVEAALAAMPEAEARKKRNKGKPEQARVSTTDAEARVMKMPDGGFRPAYNVQFAAETQHGLVAGVAVTTSGADQDALDDMHAKVTHTYGRAPANWLVDGGYVSQDGIEAVVERGSKLHAPAGEALANCDSPAIVAWRQLMASEAGKLLFRKRGQTIEWVNAGARNGGLYRVLVRGVEKVRAVALWHAVAHNFRCVMRIPTLRRVAWKPA
jgi:transposase